jgi:peptidoglycan/xylan/chitin deacetylase (PgdA/CDA1 family)
MSRESPGRRAAILLYHRVAEDAGDPFRLCVTPKEFDQQMGHVASAYQVLTLAELQACADRADLPDRGIAVTFDDGYLDNLTTASPILLDHRIPATFFLTTRGLDAPREYWWDVMARSEDLRVKESRDFHQRVVHSSLHERDSLLESRARTWPPGRSDTRPMVEREVKDLASRPGHDVGAHTVNHLYLPRQDASVVSHELVESRQRLESLLRRPIQALAYPFGGVDYAVREAVGDSGFACAVTVESRLVREGDDPLLLPRVTVPSGMRDFERFLQDKFDEDRD